METKNSGQNRKTVPVVLGSILAAVFFCNGCGLLGGYSNESLFRADVGTVYVEMFENQGLRRGMEYDLTDALAKRIEAHSGYRIVSNREIADTVISGQIRSISSTGIFAERQTGRTLERETSVTASVSWKNLKNGELLIDSEEIMASATYSEWQNQGAEYGQMLAANKLAKKIVERMEKQWE